ncbi:MAG: Lrp/AsnC family transcriptional regulator [Pseudomonadota bacterium]
MHTSLDSFDHQILRALEKNGALTNAQLSETVNLSTSQCSRRRVRLEKDGFILGYHARLNADAMGITLRAVVRVNLNSHSAENENEFTKMLASHDEIVEAFSVSGDADYILILQCENLARFADFIHSKLLPQPVIGQVRSEIVLKEII